MSRAHAARSGFYLAARIVLSLAVVSTITVGALYYIPSPVQASVQLWVDGLRIAIFGQVCVNCPTSTTTHTTTT